MSNSINCPEDLARVDGSGCGNGLVCDGAEVCRDGACVAGETLVCEADSPCLESTGECVSLPTSNIECGADEECRDGNVCNGVERCVSGRCRAGQNLTCDDGSACTTDTCSPAVGSCVSSRATISCQD